VTTTAEKILMPSIQARTQLQKENNAAVALPLRQPKADVLKAPGINGAEPLPDMDFSSRNYKSYKPGSFMPGSESNKNNTADIAPTKFKPGSGASNKANSTSDDFSFAPLPSNLKPENKRSAVDTRKELEQLVSVKPAQNDSPVPLKTAGIENKTATQSSQAPATEKKDVAHAQEIGTVARPETMVPAPELATAPVAETAQQKASDTASPAATAPVAKASAGNATHTAAPVQPNTPPRATGADRRQANAEQKAETSSGEVLQSLANSSPVGLAASINHATQVQSGIRAKEKDSLRTSLPVIPAPTGLPVSTKYKIGMPDKHKGKMPEMKYHGSKTAHKLNVNHPVPVKKAVPAGLEIPKPKEGKPQDVSAQAHNAIAHLPVADNGLDTGAGPRPHVDLSGEADPGQNEHNKQLSDQRVTQDMKDADKLSHHYAGENDIFPNSPTEELYAKANLSASPAIKPGMLETPALPAEFHEPFNHAAKKKMDADIQVQIDKHAAAHSKMEADGQMKRQETDRQIAGENERAKAEQRETQQQAQQEVKAHRTEWQKENKKITEDYQHKSEAEKQQVDGKIEQKVNEADKQVVTEMNTAEQEANEKKRESEEQARKEKEKAQQKPKGFWDKLGDAVGNFFDDLKNAVNSIFDGLRKFVKFVIEKAKQAVNALIDLARNAITGLVKMFGEALKKFVSIALAAFPELAKKVNALIDKAVNAAVKAVNFIADKLKKIAGALLDVLGKSLDFILAAYQKLCTLIIDAIKLIADILIKIIRFIATLVAASRVAGMYTPGALAEEALGANVTEAIPNVERNEEEIVAFNKKYGMAAETVPTGEVSAAVGGENKGLYEKQRLNDNDVTTETPNPVVLEPEVIAQASAEMGVKNIYELGGAGGEAVTTKDLRDATFEKPVPAKETEAGVEEAKAQDAPEYWANRPDDEKLDRFINEMTKQPAEDINPKEKPSKPQNDPQVPIELKTGKLSIGKRLAFIGQQMVAGMKMFWAQHKAGIIAALVGVFAVGAVVALFTGGAGLLALVPMIMEAMTIFFLAQAVYNAGSAFMDYLKGSWAGSIVAAGKSLAKAFAVIVVNFLMDYVFKGLGKVMKEIKGFIKGTKAFRKVSIVVGNLAETGSKLLRKTGVSKAGGAIVKNGKYVLKQIETGLGKGVKKLEELREKILRKFGFKRLWLEKHGHRLELWGEFNAKRILTTFDLINKVKAKLNLYPQIIDPRTGRFIPMPHVDDIVPKELRVLRDKARFEFIKQWHEEGYPRPKGGWEYYDIHHIKPVEFGGKNDFWNLVPVERELHKSLNEFWKNYGKEL
jgi:hypothetical protein